MANWNRETSISFALGAVRSAIEEASEYGSIEEALESHLANALCTINENGGNAFILAAEAAFEAEAAALNLA